LWATSTCCAASGSSCTPGSSSTTWRDGRPSCRGRPWCLQAAQANQTRRWAAEKVSACCFFASLQAGVPPAVCFCVAMAGSLHRPPLVSCLCWHAGVAGLSSSGVDALFGPPRRAAPEAGAAAALTGTAGGSASVRIRSNVFGSWARQPALATKVRDATLQTLESMSLPGSSRQQALWSECFMARFPKPPAPLSPSLAGGVLLPCLRLRHSVHRAALPLPEAG
jgi:hypothetical protein